jgi:hypothetical protein
MNIHGALRAESIPKQPAASTTFTVATATVEWGDVLAILLLHWD